MLDSPEAGTIFLNIFVPNCVTYLKASSDFILTEHTDIPFAEEESHLNFYISLQELMCQAIKRAKSKNFNKDLLFEVYPIAMNMVLNSTNVIAVIKSTVCIKAYMLHMPEELINKGYKPTVYKMLKKLLDPKETEILSNYIGNIVMITIEKIDQSSSNIELLTVSLQKMLKCSLPSTIQGLALLFSRFLIRSPADVLNYLTTTQIDTRMGAKVLMDRWMLHQPKFIGRLTKNTTYKALVELFSQKDKRQETLLVIGYDPSHTNKSPEVAAPLKILSTLIRCLDNELKIQHRENLTVNKLAEKYQNDHNELYGDDGRLDTINDDDDDFDEDDMRMNNLEDDVLDNVAVHIQPDYEDIKDDIEARFKKGGFEAVETQSQSIMSAMQGFDEMEGNECDEATEDDLRGLADSGLDFEQKDMLKEFLKKEWDNNREYLERSISLLPSGDQTMFKKHVIS